MRFSEIISEASSNAQRAAIAIAMKKAGKKPKDVAEGLPNADVKKQISKFEELALAANRAGDDAKCKQYQQKIQALKQKMSQGVAEEWSKKYKSSINCSHPKGFSQKAHCAGKKKHNESIMMEMVCEDCGMCQTHGDNSKDKLDELKCWSGFHRVKGTKAGFPGSCAKNKTNEELDIEEDRENFNGINLLLQKDEEEVFVKASAGSRELGHVLFVMDGDYLMPQDLEVGEKYRGQGIAQTMYDFVKSKGYKIRRSGQQTDAGAGFWAKHRPEQNVWEEQVLENLHNWFKEKWVRFGPDGKIRGDCARGSESEGKPKCLPQSKAHSLGKKGRASAASRKRREDPNANRSGKAINVSTKGKGK
jgi:hypothetical protein